MAGITSTGFFNKQIETILSEIREAQQSSLGNDIDVSPSSAIGQINASVAILLKEIWDGFQALYAERNVETASGANLDMLLSLVGAKRNLAKPSTVELTLTLQPATTVLAGSQVSLASNTNIVFATNTDVSNEGGTTADFTVQATCTQTGPIEAAAGTLTNIITSVSGWDASTNASAAIVGQNRETDAEAKTSREAKIEGQGSGTIPAIRSALAILDGVQNFDVLENRTTSTDANGLPGLSYEAIVNGGSDADIGQLLYTNNCAGTQTFGSTSVVVIDDGGNEQTYNFSRPTFASTGIGLVLDVTTTSFGATNFIGGQKVYPLYLDFFKALEIGPSVKQLDLLCAPLPIAGVNDVSLLQYGELGSVTLDINLDDGVTIPAGTRIWDGVSDPTTYILDQDLVNNTGSTTTISATATQFVLGTETAAINTVTILRDGAITGVNSITNPAASTGSTIRSINFDYGVRTLPVLKSVRVGTGSAYSGSNFSAFTFMNNAFFAGYVL